MNSNKIVKPADLDGYLSMRLERLYEGGLDIQRIRPEFEMYEVPIEQQYKLILESPYVQDPKIKGAIMLFGVKSIWPTTQPSTPSRTPYGET